MRVLPVLTVGQLMVHRPHSRHDAMSSSVFHPYCSTCETPKVSAFSKSLIGASRPRGFRLRKKRFSRREEQMAQLGEGEAEQQPENEDDVDDPKRAMVHHAGADRAFDLRDLTPQISPFSEIRMLRVDARALEHQPGDGDQHHHQHRDFVAETIFSKLSMTFSAGGGFSAVGRRNARRAPSARTPRISSRKKVSIAAL